MSDAPEIAWQPAILRGAAYGTVTPLTVIQQEFSRSRNWTRVLADSLANQGFLEKKFVPKMGRGRPTAAYSLTKPGAMMLQAFVEAEASRFAPGRAVAGPVWSLAQYGFPFAGQKDAFVQRPGLFAALLEIEAPTYVLESPVQESGTFFPTPERLGLWLLSTGDERYVLAAPFLLRDRARNWADLWNLAATEGITGRLAFVLAATGQRNRIPRDIHPGPTQQLVRFGTREPEPLGAEFHVTATIPTKRFEEFEAVYRRR